MNLNRILIQGRLLMLNEYVLQLNQLAHTEEHQFCQDKIRSAAAESYLRRALEVVFDIGRHILAKSSFADLAMEYKSIARGLAQQGIVPEELGEKLVQMAGYRNRLVHLYHQITDKELLNIISENLDDFRLFSDSIKQFLRKSRQD